MKTTKFKETEIGKIPKEWEVRQIGNLVSINELTINKRYTYEKIEYIDISSVDKGNISDKQLLNLSKAPSRAKRIVRNNDILLSTVRPNLKHFAFIKKAKENTIASTGFAVITAKKVIPQYLYYYLTTDTYTNYLASIADAHTSTYPSFNPDIIENSNIAYPSKSEQEAIAKILSDLDSKIELNLEMNKNLEAIAQTLFKHWFVDFEFPSEKGKPYKSSGGEMVDSELGKIPKGWEVGILNNITDKITKGTTPTTIGGKFTNKGINFIKVEAITDEGVFLKEKFNYIDDNTNNLLSRSIIKENDILYSIAGSIGRVAIVLKNILPANTNQAIAIIRPKQNQNSLFIKQYLKSKNFQYYTKQRIVQAVQANVSLGILSEAPVIYPSEYVLNKGNQLFWVIQNKIEQNQNEIETLTNIRDSLLPRLLSGKIRVGSFGEVSE